MAWRIASLLVASASFASFQAMAESCMPALPGFVTAPASIGAPHTCLQDYPLTAVRLGEEGKVRLAYTIKTDGTIRSPWVIQSSGFADLDQAALDCSHRFVYRPAMSHGKPVEVPWQITIQFKLTGWGTQPYVAAPSPKPYPPARKPQNKAKPNRRCTPVAMLSGRPPA
jgi:TonB family protein